jgi:hypothetical protein
MKLQYNSQNLKVISSHNQNKLRIKDIIGNFKNPLVSREQLNRNYIQLNTMEVKNG